jgi:hypothetical protein
MNKTFSVIAIVLGIGFVALALFYWMTPANGLPTYLPGYDPATTTIHFKHGLASFILGGGLFVYAWFASSKKK